LKIAEGMFCLVVESRGFSMFLLYVLAQERRIVLLFVGDVYVDSVEECSFEESNDGFPLVPFPFSTRSGPLSL
jgi:hypothetical protein